MDIREILVTQRDHGRMLETGPGVVITVRLDEPFTSGYQWEMGVAESAAIEHLDTEHIAPVADVEGKRVVGQPWTCQMRFRTRASGSGPIRLRLRRPWEPEGAAAGKFDVLVSVR